jgi:hypothetical protein
MPPLPMHVIAQDAAARIRDMQKCPSPIQMAGWFTTTLTAGHP